MRALFVAAIVVLAVLAGRATAAPRTTNAPTATRSAAAGPIVIADCGDDDGPCDGVVATGDGGRAIASDETTPLPLAAPCDIPSPCAARPPFAPSQVAAAAVRAAGLTDDPTSGWRYRARLAGLVPIVSTRVGNNLTWREVDDPTLGHTSMYDVRATWQLERLMFDPNEVRIEAMDVSRRRERRRVEMEAIHTYYAWLEARAAALRAPSWRARADELTADLDVLTAGWFTATLVHTVGP